MEMILKWQFDVTADLYGFKQLDDFKTVRLTKEKHKHFQPTQHIWVCCRLYGEAWMFWTPVTNVAPVSHLQDWGLLLCCFQGPLGLSSQNLDTNMDTSENKLKKKKNHLLKGSTFRLTFLFIFLQVRQFPLFTNVFFCHIFVQFLGSREPCIKRSDSTSCGRQILKSSPSFFDADEFDHSSPSHCQVTFAACLMSPKPPISTRSHPPSLSADFQSLQREEKCVARNSVSHSCSLDIFLSDNLMEGEGGGEKVWSFSGGNQTARAVRDKNRDEFLMSCCTCYSVVGYLTKGLHTHAYIHKVCESTAKTHSMRIPMCCSRCNTFMMQQRRHHAIRFTHTHGAMHFINNLTGISLHAIQFRPPFLMMRFKTTQVNTNNLQVIGCFGPFRHDGCTWLFDIKQSNKKKIMHLNTVPTIVLSVITTNSCQLWQFYFWPLD